MIFQISRADGPRSGNVGQGNEKIHIGDWQNSENDHSFILAFPRPGSLISNRCERRTNLNAVKCSKLSLEICFEANLRLIFT